MKVLYGGIRLPGAPDLENVRQLDLLPLPMLQQMHRYGIAIDLPYLRAFSADLAREMTALEKDIASYLPPDRLHTFAMQANTIEELQGQALFNANSADQIRELLFTTLKVGSTRDLKRTKHGALSTGKKQLELCRDDHPIVPLVLEYRMRQKLQSAFAESLPQWAVYHPAGPCCPVCELVHVESTYRVHTEFLTTRAETGRLASRRPNLQQIPVRSDLGGRIRRAFLASPGTRLVSVDFSQIELRDLAHLANARSMIEIYRDNKDIHLYTACQIFDKDYDHYAQLARYYPHLTPEEKQDWKHFSLHHRLPSKNVNFMIVYGASDQGLQAQLALSGLFWSLEQCQSFIHRWFSLYPEVEAYLDLQHYRARRYEYVWDTFGRIRRVPEVRSCHAYIRSQGLRQAGNMPIQSCSAGQLKLVMGELHACFDVLRQETGTWIWPLLSIHDQLIVEVTEPHAADILTFMTDVFSSVMRDRWRVPILADGEVLTRWSKEEAA